MRRKELGQLLGMISNLLLTIADDQFQNLLNGKAELVYQEKSQIVEKQEEREKRGKISKRGISKKTANEMKKEETEVDLLCPLIEQLLLCKTREQVKQFLHDSNMKKDELTKKLAKQLNVHVTRNDRKDVILDKIVEVVVGVKLR